MSEDMKEGRENISAYLDDALSQAELEALVGQRQEQGSGVASRYQMIGEVLRGQMSDASMVDVRLEVREALDVSEVSNNAFENKEAGGWRSMFDLAWLNPAWYRPVGGLAVAASVAMIMVITINHEETAHDSNLNNNLIAGTSIEDTAIKNMPVVSMPVSTSVASVIKAQNADDQRDPRVNLDAYLAEHAEFAAQDTMQGMIPYARAVSYEAE